MRINRRRLTLRPRGLTRQQKIELLLGPASLSAFAGEAEKKEAWFENRLELLELVNPTTRPWGFWQYEQGGQHPRDGKERATLERLGLLTPEEKRIIARWSRSTASA